MSAPSPHHYLSIIPDFRQSWKVQRNNGDTETTQASKFTRLPGHHRRHGVSEKDRGRQETRHHIVKEFTEEFQELGYEWPGSKTVGVVM